VALTDDQLDAALVEAALATFSRAVTLEQGSSPDSHLVLHARGVDCQEAIDSIGAYLIACLAGAVRVDTGLAARILSSAVDPKEDLRRRALARLQPASSLTGQEAENWLVRRRNPWITEGLAHALLCVAGRQALGCVDGQAAAVKPLHPQVSQQGLDVIAIYTDKNANLFLAVGESKASKDRPSQELTNAAGFFGMLERGERDGDLVADLLILEPVLDPGTLDGVGAALWADSRTYVPLVAHGTSYDAKDHREVLAGLRPAREHKRVLLISLEDFDGYFAGVADAALRAIDRICR
jgi:hypothetical protein